MTGAYLRALRNGKWDNIEVEYLTEEELKSKFLTRPPEELVNWMSMLCAKLREIEPILNDLVEDGILVLADKGDASHSDSENDKQPTQ
jgi:hypothetical protein